MATDPRELTLHIEREVPASPLLVFSNFVEPHELARWFGPKGFTARDVQLDARVGGRYRITMQPPEGDPFVIAGEFREIDSPMRVVYTFRYDDPDPDDRETVVEVTLDDLGESTRVVVDQAVFATEARLALHEQGWTDSLERLHEVVTSEHPHP